MPRLPHIVALALALLVTSACGSSGGGDSGGPPALGLVHPNTRFTGTYLMNGIAGSTGPERVTALWGTVVGDGDGTAMLSSAQNSLGVITPLAGPSPIDFAVGFDGTLSLGNAFPGDAIFQGGISEDGDVAVAMMSLSGIRPSLMFMGRQEGGGYDESSIAGTYHMASYGATALGPQNGVWWGTITFDGVGAGTYEHNVNQEGIVVGPIVPAFTYSVTPAGILSIDFGIGNTVEGSITAGGEVLFASGGQQAGENMRIVAMVRQGAGHMTSDLAGTWFVSGFGHDLAGNSYYAFEGGLLNDDVGDGNLLLRYTNGVEVLANPVEMTMSGLAADGTLELTDGGVIVRGGVSSNSRYAVLAGGIVGGNDPVFMFLMR